jgi:Rrf2 family protein
VNGDFGDEQGLDGGEFRNRRIQGECGDDRKARALSKPLVGKLMSQMSTAGLVNGTPGPGGGFFLSREPSDISLLEIVRLFEKVEEGLTCPFGPGCCGVGDYCRCITIWQRRMKRLIDWLTCTTLETFTTHPVKLDRSTEPELNPHA